MRRIRVEPYQRYTSSILSGRGGKTTAAFFDFDGTIIATHSVKDMFMERLKAGEVGGQEFLDMGTMMSKYIFKVGSMEDAMASSFSNLEGMPESRLIELGEKVARERLAAEVFPEVRAMVQAHQAKGHTVAIVSSATRYQIAPIAGELGISHLLCTELQVRRGRFTGAVSGKACYGRQKALAVRAFCQGRRIQLRQSYFYSNGAEDRPLLDVVGHPVAINPDRTLAKTARQRKWPVHQLQSRGSTGVTDVARTLATFGSALPLFAAGLPLRALGASPREATNFSISAWASLASMVSRLKLLVHGEENLWSQRPAVFLFNHQSAMDMLICARLMREDVVGIAKKEVQRQPLVGPVLRFAGTVFIDRENVRDPQQALKPAVDALAAGRSVVIAPEGTRSRDGSLGKFKRGAFHMARQAGVPVVPIVIHNATDALPNRAMVIRPAEVKVTVLKPISSDGWRLRDVAIQSRRVRDLYLKTLGRSPGQSDRE